MYIRYHSMLYVEPGSVIQFDDDLNSKYRVYMCIRLEPLGGKGYQMNLIKL